MSGAIDNLGSNISGIQEATVGNSWSTVVTPDDNITSVAWGASAPDGSGGTGLFVAVS